MLRTSLLLGNGVSQDIIVAGIPVLPSSQATISSMDNETALVLQYFRELGAEDLFKFFQVSFGEVMEGPVRAKQPVGDNDIEVRMKPGIIPEGVDHHSHAQYAVIEAQHGSKEDIQTFFGTVAQLRRELAVVLEIDAQQDQDAEDELSMRDGIEDVVGNVFPKLNRFLGMATRAKPAVLA